MSVQIQRPSGVNVGVNNPGDTLYIFGNESTDGSLRFQAVLANGSLVTEVQERISGLWQPASFKTGAESVIVGTLAALSAAGSHVITTDTFGGINFLTHSSVSDGVTTRLSAVINALSFTIREVIRSDESTTFTGTSIENTVIDNSVHLITDQFYFKTGATAATEPVRIEAWNGTDDTGIKIFDQVYPASSFPANTEISLSLAGLLEFAIGANTFTRVSSSADFSLKTNPAKDAWWLAIDFSEVKEDDVLQTTEWLTGDTFTKGDWTTQDRKVYACNVTGIQTGTFASNLDKWDLLPTEHDRQQIAVAAPITTTSVTFVSIPGASFITSDLSGPGNYQVWLSLSIQQSNNNSSITIRGIIDGVPGEGRTVQFGPNTANQPETATLIGQGAGIAAGKTVEFEWLVSGGTGQINNMRILLDGILDSRVVTV